MSRAEEETALIRAVGAEPDEDTPRLAYADWLDENGQPDRARFIRIQCQIVALQEEELKLIARCGPEWGQPLFDLGVDERTFHRGFPEEIRVSPVLYLKNHDLINDLTPVRSLHLNGGTDEELRQLAALPTAHQLHSLEVRGDFPDPCGIEGVSALAASPRLSGLRRLTLHSNQLDASALNAIADSPTFVNLTHLALTSPALAHVERETLIRILNPPHLSHLVEFQHGSHPTGPFIIQLAREAWANRAEHRGPP